MPDSMAVLSTISFANSIVVISLFFMTTSTLVLGEYLIIIFGDKNFCLNQNLQWLSFQLSFILRGGSTG